MTKNKSLNSNGLIQTLAEVELMKTGLKEMGCEIVSIAEFERQCAAKAEVSPVVTKPEWIKEESRPSYCNCDYLVNGKSGRICSTHLFEMFRKNLEEKKS